VNNVEKFAFGLCVGCVILSFTLKFVIYMDKEDCNQKFNTTHENSCILQAIPESEYEQIKQKYGVK
jgi:hypothetical protein